MRFAIKAVQLHKYFQPTQCINPLEKKNSVGLDFFKNVKKIKNNDHE